MKNKKQFFLLALFLPLFLVAQKTITGTVVDKTNFPLPGASIVVKGTTKGVVSDFDGKFALELDKTPATIVVSYVGYQTQEVLVDKQSVVTVVLPEDTQQLNEVVVIGYGAVKKGDLTGSVTQVKPKEDAVAQSQSVESLLQGKAAGVVINTNGSDPNAASSVKIRGLNSLTSNTEPLYVIDGVIVDSATEDTYNPIGGTYLAPQGGININPRDIESIQVLKDASATAIYGSRAANGVIVITTKKGKKGEAKFNYSMMTRVGEIANRYKMLGFKDYVNYQNDVKANEGLSPAFYTYPDGSVALFDTDEQYMIDNAATIERLTGVDWGDEIYKNSVTYNHRLSVSGGSEKGNYYISGGYLRNEGIIPRSFAQKTDLTLNLNNDLTDKVTLGTKVSVAVSKNSASKGTDNLGGSNRNLIGATTLAAPYYGFGANGDYTNYEDGVDDPRAWVSDYDDLAKDIRVLGAMKLDYKLSKIFTYRMRIGTDYRNKERKIWYGPALKRGFDANGEAGIANLSRFRYNVDNMLMFKKKINKNNRINGTIGFIFDESQLQRTANAAKDFAIKDLHADGLSSGATYQAPYYNKQAESIFSYLGRLNYTFHNKYLLTASLRADKSSKFAKGKQWGYFPALALAWKADKEGFLKNIKSLSKAKVRLGWGLTGNQGIPNYKTLTPYSVTASPYDGVGLVPSNLANPDLTWETTSQYNAGLDLGFIDNRFTLTTDVYYKEISDLLFKTPIGPSNGFVNYYANQGNLINKGIEFSGSFDIVDNDKVKWNVYGNIAFNKNEVGDLGIPPAPFGTQTYSAFLGTNISGGNYFKAPANIFIEGEAPGLFWGYQTNGIINNIDELNNAPTVAGQAPQMGDVLMVDQNGDGEITDDDLTVIGDPNPDFNYGFGTSVSYARFSLSCFFNGVYGNDVANGNLLREDYADKTKQNVREDAYFDAWTPTNPNGAYPRVGYDLADDTRFTDRIVEDGSFLRLSNVTLGYEIPVDAIKNVDNAYISISGQNLLLFTNYKGFDPEVNSFSYDPSRVGVDWGSFPNQRSVSISLNLTF